MTGVCVYSPFAESMEAAWSSGHGVGFACGCPRFKSRSNLWLDLFPVVPDSTLPTACLVPVGVLNHVSFKLLKMGCL